MKIISIRGRNLASLAGDFFIDFEAPPLNKSGIFAISGPTGSGKTTILDTICLALFGKTPRLTKSGSGAPVKRDESDKGIGQSDPASILRHGTGEGFAEVVFIGCDRNRYRARWSIRRARGSPNGKLQNPELELFDIENRRNISSGNVARVCEQIEEKLGLSFEQFKRAVLLAQGDFAAFLKSSRDERSQLLERITGAQIYTKLSIAAFEKAKHERGILEQIQNSLSNSLPLPDEERKKLENQFLIEIDREKNLNEKLDYLKHILNWFEIFDKLVAAENEAKLNYALAKADFENNAWRYDRLKKIIEIQSLKSLFEERKKKLNEIDTSEVMLAEAVSRLKNAEIVLVNKKIALEERQINLNNQEKEMERYAPLIREVRELDIKFIQTNEILKNYEIKQAEVSESHSAAEKAYREALEKTRKLEAEIESTKKWLLANNSIGYLADNWPECKLELNFYIELKNNFEKLLAEVQKLETKERNADLELNKLASELKDQRKTIVEFESILNECTAYEKTNPHNEIIYRRDELQAKINLYKELYYIASTASEISKEIAKKTELLDLLRVRQKKCDEELCQKDSELKNTSEQVQKAIQDELNAISSRKEDVLSLRRQLKEGFPCPVCGSLEHPWVSMVAITNDEIEKITALAKELKQRETELLRKVGALHKESETLKEKIADTVQELQGLAQHLENLQQKWSELTKIANVEFELSGENTLAVIKAEMEKLDHDLNDAKSHEAKLLEVKEKIRNVQEKLEKSKLLEKKVEDELTRLNLSLIAVQSEKKGRLQQIEELQEKINKQEITISKWFDNIKNWKANLGLDAHEFYRYYELRVAEYKKFKEKAAEIEKELEKLNCSLPLLERQYNNAKKDYDSIIREFKNQENMLKEIVVAKKQLLNGESVDVVEERLANNLAQARKNLENALNELHQAQIEFTQAELKVVQSKKDVERIHAELTTITAKLENELYNRQIDIKQAEEWLKLDQEWLQNEEATLKNIKNRLLKAEAVANERIETRINHEKNRPTEKTQPEIVEEFKANDEKLKECRKLIADLQVKIFQDDERRREYRLKQEEYEKQSQICKTWDALNELIGSADGKKFREFAQGITFQTLVQLANIHLDELSGRYRLQRIPGTSLELQVIDREFGDEVRSINSLSGGETFIASLALSLALASLSSGQTQVESLFIDEGFGTLDPQTLDIVLGSLDALQATGRQIGVISHIPTLVERIGTLIKVEPIGKGKSKIRVLTSFER